MEEILASIRRIIADDQSMPGHVPPPGLEPTGAVPPPSDVPDAALPVENEAATVVPEAFAAEPSAGDASAFAAAPTDLPSRHGIVTSPQFPSPEGLISVMDTPHPLAPVPERVEGSIEVTPPRAEDVHERALREMHEEPEVPSFESPIHEPPIHEPPFHEPPFHEPPFHESSPTDGRGGDTGGLFSASTSQSLASAFNTLAVSRLVADSTALRGLTKDLLRPLLKDWLDEHLPTMVEAIIRDEIVRMTRRPD